MKDKRIDVKRDEKDQEDKLDEIFLTEEIELEEMAIDGICGVY
ncbi:MAG: mycofactocin precursor MftA [Desulfatiglandaceae bacterium]|jgi:mycofactocin precursor